MRKMENENHITGRFDFLTAPCLNIDISEIQREIDLRRIIDYP